MTRRVGARWRLGRAHIADYDAAMIGAASTTVTCIQDAACNQQGRWKGLTAVKVGGNFLLALFLAHLAASAPGCAKALALVFLASLMAKVLKSVDWADETEYSPTMLIVLAMPLTFFIATGSELSSLAYAGIKTFAFRAGEVHCAVSVFSGLRALKFAVG